MDNDAQSNATDAIGVNGQAKGDMFDVFYTGTPPGDLKVPIEEGLDVIPATRRLSQVDQWLSMQTRREEVLKRRMKGVNGYDFVILDTAPAFSLINLNSLTYATEAWLPVSMEYLALQGVKQIMDTLKMIAEELDHQLEVKYVIPMFYDVRNSKTAQVVEALKSAFGKRVTTPVRSSVRVSEAPSYHQSIYDYAPSSTGAEDFEAVVRRILKG